MTTRIAFTESSSLTPTTVFAASGALAVGDVVYQVAGADKTVAKADADNALVPPIGVVHSVVGTDVIIALNGEVAAGLTGLTRGTTYWLGTTAGALVSSKPASNAYIVGVAVSSSELLINTVAADLVIGSSTGTVTSFDVSSSDLTITNDPITSSGVIDLALNTVPVSKGGTGLTSATEQGASLIASSSSAYVAQASSLSWRNRVINGDMRVAQRGTAAVTVSDTDYPVDRIHAFKNPGWTGLVATAQQSTDAPTGFSNSFLYTVSTGSSTTGYTTYVATALEGSSIYDFGWGTASAKTVTASFWVKSSLAGTYSLALQNKDVSRSYVSTFSVASAGQWERKTITIPGDTSGVWSADNTTGVLVIFALKVSSNSAVAPSTDSWLAGSYGIASATQTLNFPRTTGRTFQITGLQLEPGSVATPFEVLPYEKQLELCQRYFARLSSLSGSSVGFGAGCYPSTTSAWVHIKYPQQMRAAPTMSTSSVGTFDSLFRATTWGASYYGSDSMTATGTRTAVAGSTGWGCVMAGNTSTSYIDLNAEL